MEKSLNRRLFNPFASLSGKLAVVMLALGSIALLVGIMSLSLFSSISNDMDALVNRKVPETKSSFALSSRVNDVEKTILELVTAASVQGIDAVRGQIDQSMVDMLTAAAQLPSESYEFVKSEAEDLKSLLLRLTDLRKEEFVRSAEIARQSEVVQNIGMTLQLAVIDAADEANFTIALGGETALEEIDATLQDIVTTKSEILQRILEVRAEVNLLSGLALANSLNRDQGTGAIFKDLAKSSADRAISAIQSLQDQDQIPIQTASLEQAVVFFADTIAQDMRQTAQLRSELLASRQAADAETGTALDEMIFVMLIGIEDASSNNSETIGNLIENEVGEIMKLLQATATIGTFQVSAIGILSAQSTDLIDQRNEAMLKSILDLQQLSLLSPSEREVLSQSLAGLSDPDNRAAANQAAWLSVAQDASSMALHATSAIAPISNLVLQIVTDRQKEIASMATNILATLAESRSQVMVLIGLAAVVFLVSMSLTYVLVARPLKRLSKATEKLADGDRSPVLGFSRSSTEILRIAGALSVFRESLVEKDQLEASAAREREVRDADQHRLVSALGNGLNALANGDLTYRINLDFKGSYGKLLSDFNASASSLSQTVAGVTSASEGIRLGSAEISEASNNLAYQTEAQANTLEQTAQAVDSVVAGARQSAQHARDVEGGLSQARKEAEETKVVVEEAVTAMSKIKEKSDSIAQIISVIEDIAFQTNLLALNAGVEAARAGEAGRGFAVVASEVRGLAQRSSVASHEIKGLIGDSGNEVARGSKLVSKTGAAMDSVLTQFLNVSSQVEEIAKVASSQSNQLEEINHSMAALDTATQSNAATAEEANAISQTLSNEISRLTQLTGKFRTLTSVAKHAA